MHVLHVTAHLGGGVGKAHAALMAVMPQETRHTYLLLEEPRDRRYADEIAAFGAKVLIASSTDEVARGAATADIVQFEFWNHPKLYECLARTDFPPMRALFWSHISGLFSPLIAPGLFAEADRFVFTSPASMVLGERESENVRSRLSVIGSGFGFASSSVAPPSALPGISPSRGEIGSAPGLPQVSILLTGRGSSPLPISPLEGEMPGRTEGGANSQEHFPICYLGTVDFIKMSPVFFDVMDGLDANVSAAIWGSYDPASDVVARATSMRHPTRIRFIGQTNDPQAALSASRIFFYPLQPDHYGTAENALIEAMSLGLVPVLLANPAECAIVEDKVTGFVCQSAEECREVLARLLASPALCEAVGVRAAAVASEHYRPERSADQFVALWKDLATQPRRNHDFARAIGSTPLDWYRSTQGERSEIDRDLASKGTLTHFKAAFPDDPCWI